MVAGQLIQPGRRLPGSRFAQRLDPTRDPIPLPAAPAGAQAERLATYRQGWAWLAHTLDSLGYACFKLDDAKL
jgi:hypothetical protein